MILDNDDLITILKLFVSSLEASEQGYYSKVHIGEFKHVGMCTKEVTITHEDFGKIVITN